MSIASKRIFLTLFSIMLHFSMVAMAQPEETREQVEDLIAYQQDFIARFSGSVPYRDGKTIKGRSTLKGRSIAREILREEIVSLGFDPIEDTYGVPVEAPGGSSTRIRRLIKGTNILFVVPANSGAQSKKQIILVAHYDAFGRSPGADDNASGVAAILGVVKHLKTLSARDLDVLVLFSDHEELGLIGSYKFVERLNTDRLDIHSVHAFDMLGWDGDGDRAVELDPGTDEIRDLYEHHAAARGIPITIIESNRSDHAAFRSVDLPSSLLIEEAEHGDFNPHYHSRKDRVEFIDFEYLASNTLLVSSIMTDLLDQSEQVDVRSSSD